MQMRYHFTLVRMLLSKSLQTINAGKGVEKSEPSHTVGGHKGGVICISQVIDISSGNLDFNLFLPVQHFS